MREIKIYFIINLHNSEKLNRLKSKIYAFFKTRQEHIFIFQTKYKGHALKLTKKGILENVNSIIACGGDGTISEVGGLLVGSSISLGIIPIGSGNGIAGHFKISKHIENCLKTIISNNIQLIDVGKANNNYFIGNMGIGFEAEFIKQYIMKKTHGFHSYLRASIMAISKFKYNKFEINDQKKVTPFMLMISNLNQQGYNLSITPKAICGDGLLDLVLLKKTSIFKIINFLFFILFKIDINSPSLERSQIKIIKIKNLSKSHFNVQMDGEHFLINSSELVVSVEEKAINLIVPSED